MKTLWAKLDERQAGHSDVGSTDVPVDEESQRLQGCFVTT